MNILTTSCKTFQQSFKFTKPLTEQWPLMLAYIILIGWSSLEKNPIPRWLLILFHSYIVVAIVTLSKSRVIKVLVYLFIYTLFFIEIVLEQVFGMEISPGAIVLLLETNKRESTEFIQMLLTNKVFVHTFLYFVGVAILNIIAEIFRQKICNQMQANKSVAKAGRILLLTLLTGGFAFNYQYISLFNCQEVNDVDEWRSHNRNPDDTVTKLLLSLVDIHMSEKEMSYLLEQIKHIGTQTLDRETDSLNVILVIGESYIKYHSALYGYPLQTTPFLSQEQKAGRLFVFTDVVSPYNQTTKVIRNVLSCNCIGEGENWASTPPLTAIFKKEGYHVIFYDNQKDFATDQLFSFSLNTYLYHPEMVKVCYNETNEKSFDYDGQLIDYYKRNRSNHKCQLIVFHLLGQHMAYSNRYPKEFAHFTSDSTSFRKNPWLTPQMREEIAHYDNATFYNDEVIHKITDLYSDENTVVIYFSDHGEEVYDYRPNIGRDAFGFGEIPEKGLHWQYDVPFIIWCSNSFANLHPKEIKALKSCTMRPFSLDNVCQILFHLSGLKTPLYMSERDILSPHYKSPKRIINDKINYDEF
ncbi:MAG: phosphoethanolamine transferase [Prevotella sp.]|nr:phosphoethanolamine transferase [Prevotella sp.]MBR1839313.1 phosphoethanolamine transferase [Prevotella sp.]